MRVSPTPSTKWPTTKTKQQLTADTSYPITLPTESLLLALLQLQYLNIEALPATNNKSWITSTCMQECPYPFLRLPSPCPETISMLKTPPSKARCHWHTLVLNVRSTTLRLITLKTMSFKTLLRSQLTVPTTRITGKLLSKYTGLTLSRMSQWVEELYNK